MRSIPVKLQERSHPQMTQMGRRWRGTHLRTSVSSADELFDAHMMHGCQGRHLRSTMMRCELQRRMHHVMV